MSRSERSDLANTDKVIAALQDKKKWLMAAAMTMAQQPFEVREKIIKAGEDEFVRVSRVGFKGQGFSTQDLREIYRVILRKTPVIFES